MEHSRAKLYHDLGENPVRDKINDSNRVNRFENGFGMKENLIFRTLDPPDSKGAGKSNTDI